MLGRAERLNKSQPTRGDLPGWVSGEKVTSPRQKITAMLRNITHFFGFRCVCVDNNKILIGNSEGKRPLGNPTRKWEDNIKIVSWKYEVLLGVGWIYLPLNRA